MTSAASASCGTHFGLTKLVTSIRSKPQSDSRSTSPILACVSISRFSFCRPSRGAISTMETRFGRHDPRHHASSGFSDQQHGALAGLIALADMQAFHDAVAPRRQRQLHLHRFHDDQRIALRNHVAFLHAHQS